MKSSILLTGTLGKTIDELYAFILDETTNDKEWDFTIRYNKTYHYPELFGKFFAPEPSTGGGGWTFTITGFKPLSE
jgi:hypothetical protein